MKNTLLIAATILSMLATTPVWGHGTEGYTETAAGIRVVAGYDDGEPMSYAAVEVTAPKSDIVFQTGRTDRNGVFMFAPDQSGKWQVTISDGMGHRLALGRQVDLQKKTAAPSGSARQATAAPVTRREGIVAGLSIIFGLCGLAYGWKMRKASSLPNSSQTR